MKNRLISIILICTMFICLMPFPFGAKASGTELTLNITKSELKGRIVLGEDCVYVYSHISPMQVSYQVSSKDLVNSLYSDKYNISYTDNEKKEKTVQSVEDGFIKLSSSSGSKYIPVKTNTGIMWSEDFQNFSSTGYYQRIDDGSLVKKSFEKNFKGKGENDISYCFEGNGDSGIYPNGEGYEVYIQKNTVISKVTEVVTLEFSFCNTSGGKMFFATRIAGHVSDDLTIDSKGNIFSDGANCGKIATGQWHKVSVSFDFTRNRLLMFIDGIYVAQPYRGFSGNVFEHFKLGMRGDKDADGNPIPAYGMLAFDDIKLYGGYPTERYNSCSGLVSDSLVVDNENRVIYGATGKEKQEALEMLIPELGGSVSLTDGIITEDSVLDLTVTNGWNEERKAKYTFSDDTYISPVTVYNTGEGTVDNVNVGFTSIAGADTPNKEAIAYVAAYKDGKMTSLVSEKADISIKKDFDINISLDREDKEVLKVFFWSDKLYPLYGSDVTRKTDKKLVFEEDEKYEELMSDFIALHSRSGLLTAYGKKTFLENKPYTKDGEIYIAPKEISDIIGVSCTVNGASVKVGDKTFSANSDYFKNGAVYIPARTYFSYLLSMKTSKFSSEYNGMVFVAGNNTFEIPSSIDVQKLNDYLFNQRPSQSDIKDMYAKSPLKGEHPRIYIDSVDLSRIKSEIQTNEYKKDWASTIVAAAKRDIKQPLVTYYIDEGGRLLGISRKVLQYMHTLGMAYLLTGDQKYADRAYLQLEAAANFPDWHSDHSLDTGEMCAAFAVGYDWMYDAFSPEQRKVIEEGFLKNGITAYNNMYEGISGRINSVYTDSNWNAVVNGGIATGALAFYDVYPENCSKILSNSVRGLEHILWRFAPDGGWYEGPGYWEYTIKYVSKMLSNTKRILGTDFAFPLCEGFEKTVDYALAIQSSNGTFSYGDCMKGKYLVPEIFWISNILSKPEYTSTLLTLSEGTMENWEDIALALCWYDVSTAPDKVFLPTDTYIRKEEVVSMRSGWGVSDSFFAVTAGANGAAHDHLDSGSFVFDTGGERWVVDSGQGNYNNPIYNYWDGAENGERWKIFALRAEAHCTVVINPTTAPDQKYGSFTDIVRMDSGSDASITELDMSDALSENAASAKRAFALTDSKQSLVIRDEIVLSDSSKDNTVYWLLMTDAEVSVNETGAVLTKNGKTLYLNFTSDANSVISSEKAKSFDETGEIDDDFGGVNLNRIVIKMTSKDKVDLTVSLSQTPGVQLLNSYDKEISEWKAD